MRRGFLLVIFLFCSVNLWAVSSSSYPSPLLPLSTSVKPFDIMQANQWLDHLARNLPVKKASVKSLSDALSELTKWQDHASNCVNSTQKQIDATEKLWEEAKIDTKSSEDTITSLQRYLKGKKDELILHKSECKLFSLRANELMDELNHAMAAMNKEALLKAKPTGMTTLGNVILFFEQFKQIDIAEVVAMFKSSDFSFISQTSLWMLLGLTILSFALARFLIYRANTKKLSFDTLQSFSNKFKACLIFTVIHYAFLILFSVVFVLFTVILNISSPGLSYWPLIGCSLLCYAAFIFLTHLLLYPFQGNACLTGVPAYISVSLATRIKWLLTLTFFGYLAYLVTAHIDMPYVIISFARTLFITLYAIGLISILWLINRLPKLFRQHPFIRLMISVCLTLSLLTIIVMEWGGYQQLVSYLLKGTALTLLFAFIAILLHKMIAFSMNYCALGKALWQRHIRKALGFYRSYIIPEFIWLKFALYLLVWCSFVIALFKVWGMSEAVFQLTLLKLLDGFKLAGLNIIPLRIFSAFIFFIIASLFIRLIKHYLENRAVESVEKGTQQALAAIVGYMGIAVILIFSLLIAGVSFAGLAIVAGALSVGIGFGLQNIVNNFVSGIILLIERPIKLGDRILVGGTEGFVKKISIRSTRIQTPMLSDLIVPNSEIVSGQVTNFMFHNDYGRIGIRVGVNYDSDTALVRKLLYDISKTHPAIIHDEAEYNPVVLLSEFGDSSLIFDLFCTLRDINLKYVVASDLRLAIDNVFRENHITIAFPQRVIHVQNERTLLDRPHKHHVPAEKSQTE